MLEILYQDEYLVVINKPHGLVVHKSDYTRDASRFALQELRNQLGKKVYPVHRLDRKTAGALIFTLQADFLAQFQIQFQNRTVEKQYLAIVRGFTEPDGRIDKPLQKDNGNLQQAETAYQTLYQAELDIPSDRHPTSRYSLVKIKPLTGRMHQIRRHFRSIDHPIIGDRPYGCNKQNRLFKQKWGIETMFLHAWKISFDHPAYNRKLKVEAPLQQVFSESLEIFNWQNLPLL